jgi:predicted outer membrane protein
MMPLRSLPDPVSLGRFRRRKEAIMATPRHALRGCTILLPLGLLAANPVYAQSNITPDSSLRLPAPPGAGLSVENRAFIDQAIGGATGVIEAGRLAGQKARSDTVRHLGSEIAADQQTIKDELTRLSEAKGYQPSGNVPAELAGLQALATVGEADLDQHYLTAQYQASRWLFAAYQTEMAATQDLDLRTFTAAHALMLRKHLEKIEKAAGQAGLRLEAPRNAPQY